MRFTASATAALWLLLGASSSDAFLAPKNMMASVALYQSAEDTSDGPAAPPPNKRKPRFAQDAHARSNSKPVTRRPAPKPTQSWEDYAGESAVRPARPERAAPVERPSAPRVYSSDTTTPPPTPQTNDFMWKTGKSIDDLENSMTSRFGLDQQQWAANPNEYEVEEEGGASDFGRSSSAAAEAAPTKKIGKRISTPKFNGKPVLDPWQREDKKASTAISKKQQLKLDQQESMSSMFDAKSDEDYILNRARRNQQQTQPDEGAEKPRVRRPKWADLVDEFDDDVSSSDADFYDEDDEGFESKRTSNSSKDYVDKLISPRPVGGQGSLNTPKTARAAAISEERSENNNPGYFFNAGTARESDKVAAETAAAAAPAKRVKQRATQLRDENDEPLYLTTAQADTNFQAALQAGAAGSGEEEEEVEQVAWDEVGITSERLLTNLQAMGCATPLSVQEKSCPSILTGNDVLVGTYTGSGKTLAFLVPLVQRLLFDRDDEAVASGDGLEILIVAPGRELASQIATVARSLLEGTKMSVVLAIGGTTFSRNLEQIRKKKPTIVVGTPGRIAELVVGQPGQKAGRMKIASLQAVVLDEFDALLEYKPHRDPTAAVMSALQRRHRDSLQSILCSATATDMVGSAKLNSYLRPGYTTAMADIDDKLITAGDDKNAVTRVSRTVMHGVIHVSRQQLALDTIRKILHTEPIPQQVLIFADNARRVDLVVEKLAQMDIIAAALHGGAKSEKMDRAEVSKALREGYVGIVVATELAARGLDAPLLTHVVNLDLPTDASHYAHRAGRCGRGGRPGVVINITTGPKERNVPRKFSEKLGVDLFTVEPRAGKMIVIDPKSVTLDV